MKQTKYVLMTPAKDEAAFVGSMLESVIDQTIRPVRHVVVDDGSKDSTAAIVERYANVQNFIELKRGLKETGRSFGSKVGALRAAFEELRNLEFDFIGCLDADMTLPHSYYEDIIRKMDDDPKLGLASGLCLNKVGDRFVRVMSNSQHVPGALQFFRRECYEKIGGYQPVSVAGVDSLAEIKVRMGGWKTRSFDDIHAFHHKPIGSATSGPLRTSYRRGMTDFLLGKHPLYVALKSIRRIAAPPFGIGAALHLAGYFAPVLRGQSLDVSEEVKYYVRTEEMRILKKAFGWSKGRFELIASL